MHQVQHSSELRTSTIERLNKLHQSVFGTEMSKFEDEIIFWIQERTVPVAMAILNLNYPRELLKYENFLLKDEPIHLIHSVCTEEKNRKRGYSSLVFKAIFDFLKTTVYLEVAKNNVPAIVLYSKLGFEFVFPTHTGDCAAAGDGDDKERLSPCSTEDKGETFYLMCRKPTVGHKWEPMVPITLLLIPPLNPS